MKWDHQCPRKQRQTQKQRLEPHRIKENISYKRSSFITWQIINTPAFDAVEVGEINSNDEYKPAISLNIKSAILEICFHVNGGDKNEKQMVFSF
jgi:hypothetical protein